MIDAQTTTLDPGSLRARVAQGADLLDRVWPGWWREISLDRLAMHSCDACVLGQLYGEYTRGWYEATRPLPASGCYSAAFHGFTLTIDEQHWGGPTDDAPGWPLLADAWRAEVARRAAEGGGAPC